MKRYVIYVRLAAGVMLAALWGLVDSPLSGVVFILALTALSIIRYRFAPYRALGVLEALVCLCYAFNWTPALLGLWLPALGLLEDKWNGLERELLNRDYTDRAERIRLQKAHENSVREAQNAARLAELSEHSRIAQDIHDHVGHEISGASIALQAAIRLHEKGDARADELLRQSAARIESASEHLREAVHNLKPSQTTGAQSLSALCEDFNFCPASFQASGDLSGVLNWSLLDANLKEALTNVSRHSEASRVDVRLDGNRDFVRLTVSDNGKPEKQTSMGLGLSGMRERVRVAGGTLSINTENGFTLITVLPKGAAR